MINPFYVSQVLNNTTYYPRGGSGVNPIPTIKNIMKTPSTDKLVDKNDSKIVNKVICNKKGKYSRCIECPHSKKHKPIGSCHIRETKCSPDLSKPLIINTCCAK